MTSSRVCFRTHSHDGKYIVVGSENQCVYIWKTHHDYSKFSSARRDRNDFWEAIKGESLRAGGGGDRFGQVQTGAGDGTDRGGEGEGTAQEQLENEWSLPTEHGAGRVRGTGEGDRPSAKQF